jgi:putative tryptophan/tyrosine transport system substrate-binding protein
MAARNARGAACDAGDRPVFGPYRYGSDCRIPAGSRRSGLRGGKNLAIEYRFTNFRAELLPEAAGDLVRLNMDLIFAVTPQAVAAVRSATTSIPIVALYLESDPVAKGYVKSLARPGGNITGMFLDIPS